MEGQPARCTGKASGTQFEPSARLPPRRSQRRALVPCLGIGLVLAIIGLAALVGMITTSISSGGAITALGR